MMEDLPLSELSPADRERLVFSVFNATGVTLEFLADMTIFRIDGASVRYITGQQSRELTIMGAFRLAAHLAAGMAGARREWEPDRFAHQRRARARSRKP